MRFNYDTIREFSVGYDFQKEWIAGRGLLLLIAFYLGGAGGGLFLASLLVGWKAGLLIAVAIVAIGKGGAHLLYLGHPLRFWRIFWSTTFMTSWLTRGLWFVALFIIFGLAYYLTGNTALMGISAFFAFCLIIYTGFVMAASPAIPFWNNPLLPIVFVTAALWSGVSLIEATISFTPQPLNEGLLRPLGLWLGATAVVALFAYLMVNLQSSVAAKESVLFLGAGRFSRVFYPGVVLLGIVIPLAILGSALLWEVSPVWLAVAGISELAGSFVLRYSLLRAGIYPPIS
jgi:sulfite dehydrogenase (quinone) subunit SoeC